MKAAKESGFLKAVMGTRGGVSLKNTRLKIDFGEKGSFSYFRDKGKSFMIASSQNPLGKKAGEAYNAEKHKQFGDFLESIGVHADEQLGKYGGMPELSYLIQNPTTKQRKEIDEWLEKHSPQEENIFIKDGVAYRYNIRDYEVHKADLSIKKDIREPDTSSDYYSEIKGRKYRLPLYEETDILTTPEEFNTIYHD